MNSEFPPPLNSAAGSRRRKILLIDDDEAQYRFLADMLADFRKESFDLEWSSNFTAGLDALASGKYAGCLLDYQLGDRSGLDLLRQAGPALAATPVILITGWTAGDIDLEAINAGALDYLVKTEITPRTLERSLRYVIKMSESMRALQLLATHDDVTGLLNRREFDRLLTEEWQRASRFGRPFAVTIVDLDRFKRVNDTFGHQVGDGALRHVASLLAGQVRSIDRVARYGGEEFAIIQIETDLASALVTTERLRALLHEIPFQTSVRDGDHSIPLTLSAGVAAYPAHGDQAFEVVGSADRALYLAKSRGRNCVVSADDLKVRL